MKNKRQRVEIAYARSIKIKWTGMFMLRTSPLQKLFSNLNSYPTVEKGVKER